MVSLVPPNDPASQQIAFLHATVEMGLIDSATASGCLKVVRESIAAGSSANAALLLVSRGFLTQAQVGQVLARMSGTPAPTPPAPTAPAPSQGLELREPEPEGPEEYDEYEEPEPTPRHKKQPAVPPVLIALGAVVVILLVIGVARWNGGEAKPSTKVAAKTSAAEQGVEPEPAPTKTAPIADEAKTVEPAPAKTKPVRPKPVKPKPARPEPRAKDPEPEEDPQPPIQPTPRRAAGPRRPEIEPAFLIRVQKAIDRGAAFLRKEFAGATSGGGPGLKAVVAFALLRSGVPPSDSVVAGLFRAMGTKIPSYTYAVALRLMALEARHVIREKVAPLKGVRTVARFKKKRFAGDDLDQMRRLAGRLVLGRLHGEGLWNYVCHARTSSTRKKGSAPRQASSLGDHSNAQFAVLGLHAAQRSGVHVPEVVWREVLTYFLRAQEKDGRPTALRAVFSDATPKQLFSFQGSRPRNHRDAARGWGYSTTWIRKGAYDAMASAGISTVVIACEALRESGKLKPDEDKQTSKSAVDGLAWLARYLRIPTSRIRDHYYYHLYSLEKAMEVTGVEVIGGRDWWHEGARELLKRQKADGSWAVKPHKVSNQMQRYGKSHAQTSLALLFLNRATLHVGLRSAVVAGRGAPGAVIVRLKGAGPINLAEVLASLATPASKRAFRQAFKQAKAAWRKLETDQRPLLIPKLAALFAHRSGQVRAFAKKALKAATAERHKRAEDYTAWHALWKELSAVRPGREDPKLVGKARDVLRAKKRGLPMRRAACIALGRLSAAEAVPELIVELGNRSKDYAQLVVQTLRVVTDADLPFDPKASRSVREEQQQAWRTYWGVHAERLQQEAKIATHVRRLVAARPGAEQNRAALKRIGRPAVPFLIAALEKNPGARWVAVLLEEMTGQALDTAAAWRAWWRKNKNKQ